METKKTTKKQITKKSKEVSEKPAKTTKKTPKKTKEEILDGIIGDQLNDVEQAEQKPKKASKSSNTSKLQKDADVVINTVLLQNLVARSVKGAGENRLLPISSLIAIQLESGTLTFKTTDTANTLTILARNIEGNDFYAVVQVEMFSKLIAKLSTEQTAFKLTENSLDVTANGSFSIPLVMDENGLVEFPEYTFKKQQKAVPVPISIIKDILNVNKASVATGVDSPYLCGYYMHDKVVTTDELSVCFTDYSLFEDPVLISADMVDLLALTTCDVLSCYYDGKSFLFEADDFKLHGPEHDGKLNYPIEELSTYLDERFTDVCSVPKSHMKEVIDRLSIFIEPYDANGAYFTFTKDGVTVKSKKSSSVETIPYKSSQLSADFVAFTCCVDIPLFKSKVDASPSDLLTIWFGNENALKLTDSKVTQVVALLEEDGVEE